MEVIEYDINDAECVEYFDHYAVTWTVDRGPEFVPYFGNDLPYLMPEN